MAEISTSGTQKRNDEAKKNRETKKEKNSGRRPTRVFYSTRLMYMKKLQKLKREMYDAIRETEGVWCTDVVRLYWDHYGKPPDLLHFRSILDLLNCMKDQLIISRSEGIRNLWICDAQAPHPPPQIKEPERKPEPEPEPVEDVPWWDPCPPEPPDRSALEEDALPGVPFAPDVFPIDCIQPGDTIPNVDLPELDSEYLDMKVYITAFYSPSHFWLRLLGTPFNRDIEAIVDEMKEYYELGEGVHRRLAHAAMKVGHYCAAFFHYWNRALIVRIVDTDHAKVLLVDQGWVVKLSVDKMKPLRRHWAKALPAQAIRARMVGVRPPNGGQLWPLFSCFQFADQTRNHTLIARLLAVDNEDRVLEVNLRNPSTKQRIKRKLVITEGIDHGTELIKAGYAETETRTSLENGERFSYYYPLFDVLESGATPSFQELHVLSENGFEPEDVPSYLKHVPPLEPIRCPTPPHLAADFEDFINTGASSSSDPLSLDSLTLNPVSSDPVKLDLAASDPVTLESLTRNPVSDPKTSDPVKLDPVSLDPVTLESLTLNPVSDPKTSDPVKLDPVSLDPVTLESLTLNPVSDPKTSDPVKLDPVSLDPVTLESLTLNPVSDPKMSDLVKLDPAASDPVTMDSLPLNPVSLDAKMSDPVRLDPAALDPMTMDSLTLNPLSPDPKMSDPEKLDPAASDSVTLNTLSSDFKMSDPEKLDPAASDSVTMPVTSSYVTLDHMTSDPVTLNPETSATPKFTNPIIVCRRTYYQGL